VALRKTILVSLDDLLAVIYEFLNPNVSHSRLDHCLRGHGLGNLRDLPAQESQAKIQRLQSLSTWVHPHRRVIHAPDGR
jgi:hypothetical protein